MKRNCNKLVLKFSIAILMALSVTNFSIASARTRETTKRRLTARVVSVDYKNRTILVPESNGHMTTVVVPKGRELGLSDNSPTMGRGHTVGLDTAAPGMIIDAYVLTATEVAETAKAASNSRKP